jgi:asparagine synthase (glutamine-hydrolysing)
MCGIVGEVTFHGLPVHPTWCRHACGLLAHRGPDGDGFFVDEGVAFGHRRLSIIDLAGGTQPMSFADGRYWITFNGEIYNYRALRRELEQAGAAFRTQSDTEVILAAFAAWGIDSFRRLNGIFAFAIWDSAEKRLVLARDHLGVKPLLVHTDAEGVRFGSELKGLLTHPRVQAHIDADGLSDYLQLGYVLTPKTIIADIHKLPPGHFLTAQAGQVSVQPFWKLADVLSQRDPAAASDEALTRDFERRLAEAVRAQLVSDVPLGAFLSGGIDSSAIVLQATAERNSGFRTFSIGFDEATFSELDYAQEAAQHLGTDHQQQIVQAPAFDALARLVWFYDEPLGDTSLIPTYFVAKLAREQVTVSLSGDGGDELLAGYDTYTADRLQSIYRHMPGIMHRRVVRPLVTAIPASSGKVSLDFRLKQFTAYAHSSPERAHFSWRLMFHADELAALTGAAAPDTTFDRYARHFDAVPSQDALHRALYVDIQTWLVDDILAKVDRASMAVGLEARVPFLDPDFVAFAMRLPSRMKMRGWTRKYILKQMLRGRLPDRIIDRKKRGFNAPVTHWMRTAWREGFSAMLASGQSRLVDTRSPHISALWAQHLAGKQDHGFRLWTLFSLLLWEQHVLNASPLTE